MQNKTKLLVDDYDDYKFMLCIQFYDDSVDNMIRKLNSKACVEIGKVVEAWS